MAKTVDPESGQELSYLELTTNSTNLLFAGVDTTSTGLTFTLYHLLANPKKWDRLCKEVRGRFSSAKEITNHATSALPYLDAVIHEGLRLRSPTPSFLPRVTPREGMMIAGIYVPGNVSRSRHLPTKTRLL